MAQFIYKTNLQDEKVRDRYVAETKKPQQTRDAGIFSATAWKEAKKQITAADIPSDFDTVSNANRSHKSRVNSIQSATSTKSSVDSLPPVPLISECISVSLSSTTKPKKASIFDRNNPLKLYKPDAQTEEQRIAKKRERKLQQAQQLETDYKQGDTPYMNIFASGSDFPGQLFGSVTSTRSSTSSGSTKPPIPPSETCPPQPGRLFKKKSFFATKSPKLSPQIAPRQFPNIEPSISPHTSPLLEPLSRCPSSSNYRLEPPASPWVAAEHKPSRIRSTSVSSSNYSRPRTRNPSDAMAFTLQSSTAWSTAERFPTTTWADRFFGAKVPVAEPPRSSGLGASRRHSFSSQGRPSFTSSRNSGDAPVSVHSRDRLPRGEGGLPYGLSNGYDEYAYTPPSVLLLDMFSSFIDEFESTPQIFGYAKDEDYQPSNASFAGSSTHLPHPGNLVVLDDELEDLKAVLKKRTWFLMAAKWLYFGRILFSPGHHLLQLNGANGDGRPRTGGDELRMLDLDGPAIADWAWHASREYPDAIIHVITSGGSGSINSPVSPLTCEYASPPNQRRVQIPSGYSTLSPLATGSIDVISSRFLPSLIPKDGWLSLILECHRVLKHDGYLELSILDPVLNDMGPLLRTWILDNILSDPAHPRSFDIMPSKTALATLREAGFQEMNKVWMWMPATSAGDELSTVTSSIGRYLYDELYCARPPEAQEEEARGGKPRRHYENEVWAKEEIMEECRQHNTAFRWLKVYVRKSPAKGEY